MFFFGVHGHIDGYRNSKKFYTFPGTFSNYTKKLLFIRINKENENCPVGIWALCCVDRLNDQP